jgi:hypothetical protein
MGVTQALPLGLLLLAALAQAKEPASFKRDVAGTEVDWSAGTITAQAGAAADMRMPGPNAARPGAERRARAAAEEKLRQALRVMGQGKKLEDKASQATLSRIEYQSNGGVVLWLVVRFSELVAAKPAEASLRVASMPFELAPTVSAGGRLATTGFATYRPAGDCPKDAVPVRRDPVGRLVLADADAKLLDSLAGRAVVIYLEKREP